MGNEKSSLQSKHGQHHHHSHQSTSAPQKDPRLAAAFKQLSSTEKLSYQNLVDAFGSDLAVSLWDYVSENLPREQLITYEQFEKHAYPLIGDNANLYAKICQPERHLIKVCSEAAGAIAVEGDEQFITSLEGELKSKSMDIATWVNMYAPRFCEGVQSVVQNKLCGYPKVTHDYNSDILSPIQMWFVKCSLPSVFFPKAEPGEPIQWTPLYTSAMQGISVNRFDANVIDYRGPTVVIFHLTDQRVIVLASDQEWRHSSHRFGGVNTTYLQLYPTIMRVQNEPNSIFCNYKLRATPYGLSFKEILKIDKDMSEIQDIEVWGCSGANTLADQQKLKQWQGQQAERNKKVPLPGNWDDNPDKTLLEMAGFQFSNERQLMELEAKHNK